VAEQAILARRTTEPVNVERDLSFSPR